MGLKYQPDAVALKPVELAICGRKLRLAKGNQLPRLEERYVVKLSILRLKNRSRVVVEPVEECGDQFSRERQIGEPQPVGEGIGGMLCKFDGIQILHQ